MCVGNSANRWAPTITCTAPSEHHIYTRWCIACHVHVHIGSHQRCRYIDIMRERCKNFNACAFVLYSNSIIVVSLKALIDIAPVYRSAISHQYHGTPSQSNVTNLHSRTVYAVSLRCVSMFVLYMRDLSIRNKIEGKIYLSFAYMLRATNEETIPYRISYCRLNLQFIFRCCYSCRSCSVFVLNWISTTIEWRFFFSIQFSQISHNTIEQDKIRQNYRMNGASERERLQQNKI